MLPERLPQSSALENGRTDFQKLIQDWLLGVSVHTRRAYSHDLDDFSRFLSVNSQAEAVEQLISHGAAEANLLALRYRNELVRQELAPATVNRRLAALRSILKLLRLVGLIQWRLEISPLKVIKYKDTRGPGILAVRALLKSIKGEKEKAYRDRAIVRLLFDMGLRRGELVALDVPDLDDKRLWILGKGYLEKIPLTIPTPSLDALNKYIEKRGHPESGPIFVNCDRAKKNDGRLSGDGLRKILRDLSEKAGLKIVRPHGLRHAAITAALDAGRDMREVLRFSRHADPRTLIHYDDARRDIAGDVSELVSRLLD